MSWPALAWALAQRAPSSGAKFVLVTLGDSASVGDWLAWPSVAYISDVTQQDRKTVLKNLKALEDVELIVAHSKAGKTKQVTVWKLPIPPTDKSPKSGTASPAAKGPKSGTDQAPETVPNFPAKSTNFPPKESQSWDTEPVKNQLGTRESAHAKRAPAADRGSRLPADWTLPDDWRAWCQTKRPDLDPEEIAATFRDHWVSVPGAKGRKSDWSATWRNWVRNERGVGGQRTAASPSQLSSDEQLLPEISP